MYKKTKKTQKEFGRGLTNHNANTACMCVQHNVVMFKVIAITKKNII